MTTHCIASETGGRSSEVNLGIMISKLSAAMLSAQAWQRHVIFNGSLHRELY